MKKLLREPARQGRDDAGQEPARRLFLQGPIHGILVKKEYMIFVIRFYSDLLSIGGTANGAPRAQIFFGRGQT